MAFPRPVRVFFSYARTVTKDRNLFEELKKRLRGLELQDILKDWRESDTEHDLKQFIEGSSDGANMIVLLISPDFLQDCEAEIQQAVELSAAKKAHIIAVQLRSVLWERSPLLRQYTLLPSDGKAVSRRSGQDAALLEVAKAILRACEEFAKSPAMSQQTMGSILESIPYRNNPFFTDRENILHALHFYFIAERTILQPCIQALKGMAGVGKTQIVIEYLYKYKNDYQKIFWLEADTRHHLCTNIVSLLDEQFFHFNQEQVDERQLFSMFRRWLQRQKQWLLVLDNLDEPEDFDLIVDLLIPRQGDGHVLLVTCSQTTGPVRAVEVKPMTEEDGSLLLLRRSMSIVEQAVLAKFSEANITQAKAIVAELGGLPLALDQAGAYIEETKCSPSEYVLLYQLGRAKLLAKRGRFFANHPYSVTVTFSLAFDKVKRERAEVLELLRLFAFLHPDAIPDEMIEKGVLLLDRPLQKLMSDPFQRKEAIAILLKYSLIYYNTDTKASSIHRLVQTILVDSLPTKQQNHWIIRVMRLLNKVFPEANFNNWSACAAYLPHAQKCAGLIIQRQLKHEDAVYLLERLGRYCYLRAYYVDAEKYLMYVVKVCKETLGSEHQHMAQTLNTLAMLYRKTGRYREAEEHYRRALAIREGATELDHNNIAQVLNNLALLYRDQGKYKEAERLLLKIDEEVGERDHPDMAIFLSNLAQVYDEQENYAEAERLYRSALDIEERLLVANHPNRALSLHNLAGVLWKQGDYQQAEELYHQALKTLEQSVGLDHVETARSLNNLANLYVDQEKYKEAEELYKRALAINERVLGARHIETARVLNNLAYLARKQMHYQQAEALYKRACHIYERILGSEHAETADVLHNLGWLYYLLKRNEEAERYLRRGLAIREQVSGPEHLDTIASLSALVKLLVDLHQYEQAEPLYKRVLEICLQRFGPEHPDTVLAQEEYTRLLEAIARQKKQ